jgi:hypothetical protein
VDNSNSGKDIHFSAINPIKKAIRISDKTLIFLDESIVKRLGIDEDNTWFEEIITENGILLRITPLVTHQ